MTEIIWSAITFLGDLRLWIAIIVALGIYVYFINKNGKKRSQASNILHAICIALLLSIFFVAVLKAEIDVPRDCIACLLDGSNVGACNPYCPDDSRFPSGHATLAFAVLGSVWITFFDKRKLVLYALPIFGIASLAAISRVVLGVHQPIDILMGALLGILIMCIVHLLNEHYKISIKKRKNIIA